MTENDLGTPSNVPTSFAVIEAVSRLHEALKATYGPDFAYTVTGKGNTLAASNMKAGLIIPHT